MRVAARWTRMALLAILAASTVAGCRAGGSGAQAGAQPSTSASTSASGPVAASSSPTARNMGSTRLVHFRAFTAAGRPATPVRAGGSGSCFITSITVPQAGAYRCLAGNRLLDPCFAPPAMASPDTVICYADPWSAGQRIHLTARLPTPRPLAHPRPWAIRLANGARCVAVTGVAQSDHGVAMTYQCAAGHAAGLGTDGGRQLVAAYGVPPKGALSRVAVTTAWTG
jgi:hypothetical protein